MAFSESFYRLTLIWALPNLEVANTSCSWISSSPIVSLDDATADALAARALDFWDDIKGLYSNQVSYQGSYVSWIATNGHTNMRLDRPHSPSGGGLGDPPLPNEVAHVVSLRTATSTRSTRGRMYLPGVCSTQMTSTARIPTTSCATIATAAALMLGDLVVGAETLTSVVASATASSMASILTTAVGDVPDAQRRRRDNQHEAYSVANV